MKKSEGSAKLPSRKKPVEITTRPPRKGIYSYSRDSIRSIESYVSLLMGIVVVIIAVLFTVSVIKQTHHIQDTTSTSIGPSVVLTPTLSPTPAVGQVYTVKPGDDLWHIAEKVYGSGYNWVDIAQANNLTDPSTIFAGDRLTLPQVSPKQSTLSPTPSPLGAITQHMQKTIPASYTVQPGDNLWDISMKIYNDGYRWVDIARVNNLVHPDLIHSGNVLQLPK